MIEMARNFDKTGKYPKLNADMYYPDAHIFDLNRPTYTSLEQQFMKSNNETGVIWYEKQVEGIFGSGNGIFFWNDTAKLKEYIASRK